MALELIAPAKVNVTLEVLGRRADGYHEIASVMQTIDLADRVRLMPARSIEIEVAGDQSHSLGVEGENLAYRAAEALAASAAGPERGVRIELEKRIPLGVGLGGGSSDAAAVLRGLDRLWELRLDREGLESIAAQLGSDVAFFLQGGTGLARGRGELVEGLTDMTAAEITLFLPQVAVSDKTHRMYATLTQEDLSDGRKSLGVAASVRRGLALDETDLFNVFDRHVGEIAPTAADAMERCYEAGLAVIAAGSGPAFFALGTVDEIPAGVRHELEGRWGVRTIVCRSLTRDDALAIRTV